MIRFGSRGSELALTQTRAVAEALRSRTGEEFEIEVIRTRGDEVLGTPLAKIGGKGLFTAELEEALREGRIDVAVHSLKDLPVEDPDGLTLGAISRREDPRDVLVCAGGAHDPGQGVLPLAPGSVVGTSSPRRSAALLAIRPDLRITDIRGNVGTRAAKVRDGGYGATILAAAGLARLGLDTRELRRVELPVDRFTPAPGQGALGVQCRRDDRRVRDLLAAIHDPTTAACVTAERELLAALGGGCAMPLGVLVQPEGGEFRMLVSLFGPDLPADGIRLELRDADPTRLAETAADRIRGLRQGSGAGREARDGGDAADYEYLLAKLDKPGPRYTSYPTAPVWRDDYTAAEYAERLHAAGQRTGEPMSLYVHIPYCNAMCFFCGCSTIITRRHEKEEPYVDRVLAEARLAREAMGASRPVAQHHWGGGTPTFLGPAMIEKLFRGLCELYPLAPDAEVSIEVDPRVTTRAQLETLAALGFNRISMGVQDFDEKVQTTINRVQSFAETEAIVTSARELGFVSVNLDLVYGLPFQTPATFARTLDLFHDLQPDRIACYSYAHVPWLKKHQRVIPEDALPMGSEKLALYLLALRSFLDRNGAGGYAAIGMDHFAKIDDELARAADAGTLHRNFMGYSTHPAEDMIAFGMSSISEMDGAFAQNFKHLDEWQAAVDSGRLPIDRGLRRSDDDERRRRIILDLMCHFRLDFAAHGGASDFRARYARELAELAPLADDGLVTIDDRGIRVTRTGRLFVRNVCMTFDAYLQRETQTGPRFSRTV